MQFLSVYYLLNQFKRIEWTINNYKSIIDFFSSKKIESLSFLVSRNSFRPVSLLSSTYGLKVLRRQHW